MKPNHNFVQGRDGKQPRCTECDCRAANLREFKMSQRAFDALMEMVEEARILCDGERHRGNGPLIRAAEIFAEIEREEYEKHEMSKTKERPPLRVTDEKLEDIMRLYPAGSATGDAIRELVEIRAEMKKIRQKMEGGTES